MTAARARRRRVVYLLSCVHGRRCPLSSNPAGVAVNARVRGSVALRRAEKASDAGSQRNFDGFARALVREAAEPWRGENRKSALARAADLLGLTARRASALFYGERATVDRAEALALQARTLGVLRHRLRQVESETTRLRQRIRAIEDMRCRLRPDDCTSPSPDCSAIWRPCPRLAPARSTASGTGWRRGRSG